MFSKSNLPKSVIVLLMAVLLTGYAFHKYQAYREDTKITRQHLALNTLRGSILHLDEALTMSARLYVASGDAVWLERYLELEPRHHECIAQIEKLLPGAFRGKAELQSAAAGLLELESSAFRLVRQNRRTEARDILVSAAYRWQQNRYMAGLNKLTAQLAEAERDLMQLHHREAVRSAWVTGAVIGLLFLGWYLLMYLQGQWQRKVSEVNRKRAEEAMEAEKVLQKANRQLRLLSAHIQDVREKERMSIAYDIHEELGQQLAAIQLRIQGMPQQVNGIMPPELISLQEVSNQLREALAFLKNLATEVYPSALKDLGLVEALESESKRFAAQANITVAFCPEFDFVPMEPTAATKLFRTYQEKLKGAACNGASEIVSFLRREEGLLVLSIHDNARYDPEGPASMELMAIKERLRSMKGRLQVERSAEEGHHITITIPYPMEEREVLAQDIY